MVRDDPVVKDPSYFNILECGKNILNKIHATCKRACMATPRYKYYTKLFRTITDCNDRNGAPLSNEKIRDTINRFISEEEVDSHNITSDVHNLTVDTLSQMPNTKREN